MDEFQKLVLEKLGQLEVGQNALRTDIERLDAKIDRVDERLSAKIDRVDERLSAKMDNMDERMVRMGGQLDGVDKRVEQIHDMLTTGVPRAFDVAHEHIDALERKAQ